MNVGRVELHLHLDGSVYMPWAWKKAVERGVVKSDCTFEEYYDMMSFREDCTLEEVFKKFDFPIAIMQTRQDLSESIYYLIKHLNDLGHIYAEIRYASQQHTLEGLTQEETIEALIDGMEKAKKDFPDVEVGLINCLMHKGENALFNMEANHEALEASKKYLGKGLVAVDLAGFENNGDFKLYAPLFEKAKELGLPYTIHAGEMGMGEHVHDAIMMGTKRIGHGINCIQKEEWLQEVIDHDVTLEICLSSNCGTERNFASHPVRKLMAAGVKVTLNSDNMNFSKTNLVNEYNYMRSLGVSEEDLMKCTLNAVDAAFCSEETKEKLRKKLGVK